MMRSKFIVATTLLLFSITFSSSAFTQETPEVDTSKYTVKIVDVISDTESADNKIFVKVEQEASFPGGTKAWTKYLSKMMMDSMKLDPNTPPGVYKIVVQFIVDKDGSLKKIEALNDYGYGLAAEAVKMIRYSPKWIPARQNKRIVKAYRRQPITIVVEDED